eukprot:1162026-Pelagomonas_calceolata.AAC.1
MIIEKWALPVFKKACFHPASICTAARTDIECACCQICNYHYHDGCESVNSEPPYPDMYVCKRTYHWTCMRELGCHNDEQRQEINAAQAWACPACASPATTSKDKINRAYKSKEELPVQQCLKGAEITTHPTLLGVGGTIYTAQTLEQSKTMRD